MEDKVSGLQQITAMYTVPGHTYTHDAYRAELIGIYMITQITQQLCRLHNITEGSITIACDGLEALRKAMSTETSCSPLSSQFDIISAIDTAINGSPLIWKWCHVKAYQDDHVAPLDRWATLNVDCDAAAKCKTKFDSIYPPPIKQEIEGEMWRLYRIPQEGKALQKISINLKEEIIEVVEGAKTKAYLIYCFLLPAKAMDKVDWYAIKLAHKNMDFFKNGWFSRWAEELIPTGTEMEDQGTWDSAKCPRNC
eukprot:3227618-Ditylum_brightwellii.AAC.2